MNKQNVVIFPGDEIGPEITTEAIKIIDYFNESKLTNISYDFADIGGAALDKHNTPYYCRCFRESKKI
jgi:3-isopropylmalate dehydrogenase